MPRLARGAAAAAAAALLALPALGQEPSAAPPAISAGALLSDYEPVHDRDAREAELFYAFVRASWEREGWGARAEVRGAEGRFREFYPGAIWLEEGYGFVSTAAGEVRVGKVERRFGLSDETFGGNLFSLDGVTRNPDWGVELAGSKRWGWNTLSWNAAYLGRNDRVSWETEGRGLESDPAASLRDAASLRATYEVNKGLTALTPGLSASTERIVREGGLPDVRRNDVAVDLTGRFAMVSLGLEAFVRRANGEALSPERILYGDAVAGMAKLTAEFPNVVWRYVYSEWRYEEADAVERQHLASATFTPKKGLAGTIEFTGRRYRGSEGAHTVNAFRFGLSLTF